MTKAAFEEIYRRGCMSGAAYMIVKIDHEGNPKPEIRITAAENFALQKEYYDRVFDDDLYYIPAKHAGKTVRIIHVIMTSDLIKDLALFAD